GGILPRSLLLARLDREVRIVGASGLQVCLDAGDDVGVLGSDIGVLVDVLLQIEQQQRRADLGPDCLPLARADGLLETPFAELPVEEVMLLLVSLAQESGQE